MVAVAAAAAELHHELSAAHFDGFVGYAMVFFAIWWSWLNYSWFASAYDTRRRGPQADQFRDLAGVPVVAESIPDTFEDDPGVRGVALRDGCRSGQHSVRRGPSSTPVS